MPFGRHARRFRGGNFTVDHSWLRATRFHVDRVGNGAEHVHVYIAPAVAGE